MEPDLKGVSRIYLFNYSARDFPFELATELNKRGFWVEYSYCSSLDWDYSHIVDEETSRHSINIFSIKSTRFKKSNLISRFISEMISGLKAGWHFRRVPDGVLILCDVPLICSCICTLFIWKRKYLVWHQDIWSLGIKEYFSNASKFKGFLAHTIERMEVLLLRRASRIICIGASFFNFYQLNSIDLKKVTLIENWTPYRPSKGNISTKNRNFRLVYSGALGLKHDIELFVALLHELASVPSLQVQVNSNEEVINYLEKHFYNYTNVQLSRFMSSESYEKILLDSTFGLVMLSSSSSKYSIPSKTLKYISFGLIPVGLINGDNLITSKILENEGAVFPATDQGARELAKWIRNYENSNLKTRVYGVGQHTTPPISEFATIISEL